MVCAAGEFAGFALRLLPLARGPAGQSGRWSAAGGLGVPTRECGGRFPAWDAGIPVPGNYTPADRGRPAENAVASGVA